MRSILLLLAVCGIVVMMLVIGGCERTIVSSTGVYSSEQFPDLQGVPENYNRTAPAAPPPPGSSQPPAPSTTPNPQPPDQTLEPSNPHPFSPKSSQGR